MNRVRHFYQTVYTHVYLFLTPEWLYRHFRGKNGIPK